jgi:hypothetical protein
MEGHHFFLPELRVKHDGSSRTRVIVSLALRYLLFAVLLLASRIRFYPTHLLLEIDPLPGRQLVVGAQLAAIVRHVVEDVEQHFVWKFLAPLARNE